MTLNKRGAKRAGKENKKKKKKKKKEMIRLCFSSGLVQARGPSVGQKKQPESKVSSVNPLVTK